MSTQDLDAWRRYVSIGDGFDNPRYSRAATRLENLLRSIWANEAGKLLLRTLPRPLVIEFAPGEGNARSLSGPNGTGIVRLRSHEFCPESLTNPLGGFDYSKLETPNGDLGRFPHRLNRQGFPLRGSSGSESVLVREAGMDGQSPFARFA